MHSDAASIMAKHCLSTSSQRPLMLSKSQNNARCTPPKRWPAVRFGARCKVTARLRFSTIKHSELPARTSPTGTVAKWSRPQRFRIGGPSTPPFSGRSSRPLRRYQARQGVGRFEASHPGATILTATEYDTAQACRNAIWYNGEAFKRADSGSASTNVSSMGLQRSPVPIDA